MIKLIDSHAHLLSTQYDEDRDNVIEEAKRNLEALIEVGCDVNAFEPVIDFSENHPDFIFPALGIHPTHCDEYNQEIEEKLIGYAKSGKIVAIGEIGIDMYWHPETIEKQISIFKSQINIAKKFNLPIIIHCRDGFEECIAVLEEYKPLKGVMHSFAGNVEQAKRVIDVGLLIGLSGPITFKNGVEQRNVAKNIDLTKLIVETDAPYLTPVPYRGKRNDPSYVVHVAEAIALEKNILVEDVVNQTTKNVRALFMKGLDV